MSPATEHRSDGAGSAAPTRSTAEVASPRHGVLLLHGLGGGPSELSYLKRRLVAAGYGVELPVLPGHGSHYSHLKGVTWEQNLEVAASAFERMAARYETVAVAGLCLGAVLTLGVGIRFGARVRALCPISTSLRFDGWGLSLAARLLPLLRFTPAYYFSTVKEEHPYGVKDEATRKWLAAEMSPTSSTHYSQVPFQSVWQMRQLNRHVLKNLHRVEAPVCAIHPVEDEVASPRSVELMRLGLTGARAFESLLLTDSYHLATIDRERRLVADTVAAFIGRHPAS